jgi:protein disulfide-isomerase
MEIKRTRTGGNTMKKTYVARIIVFSMALAGSVFGELTEESIRQFFEQRDELIQQEKYEELRQLYTSNVTIRISYMGTEEKLNATEYFSDGTNEEADVEMLNFTTTPKIIEITENGQSARIDSEMQSTVIFAAEGEQATTFCEDEIVTVTNTGNGLKISSVLLVYKYIPELNELYRRVMTRLEEAGNIDKETAIAWLKEAGCSYQESDGKRRKTTVSSRNNFNCGDEIAALAAHIPGVQVLWLNRLSDEGIEYLAKIQDLEVLFVMHSTVTDAGVTKLVACTNLTTLCLSNSQLSDKALEHIAALPNLTRLQFNLEPNAKQGLAHLAHAVKLDDLMIYNVPAECLPLLENIPNLQRLVISGKSIRDEDLFHFENMEHLKSLWLTDTGVTYEGTRQLKNKCPDLSVGPEELANPCKSSLRRIEMAKKSWAKKNKKENGSLPTPQDLDPRLKAFGGWDAMTCQDGGTFSINPIGQPASCSIHGAEEPRKKAPPLEGLSKDDFDIAGAAAGRWTMDLEAAKKLAAAKQLPILLNFTGSDWCHWCKLMEKNVFTQPDWKVYAKDNIIMVLIDFPRDKTMVPEQYKVRNDALKEQYKISGYPTFVLLKPDGTTELARLKAGRDKTPSSFIEEVKALLNTEGE